MQPDVLGRIAILPDVLYEASISPLIYGDFVEFLGERFYFRLGELAHGPLQELLFFGEFEVHQRP